MKNIILLEVALYRSVRYTHFLLPYILKDMFQNKQSLFYKGFDLGIKDNKDLGINSDLVDKVAGKLIHRNMYLLGILLCSFHWKTFGILRILSQNIVFPSRNTHPGKLHKSFSHCKWDNITCISYIIGFSTKGIIQYYIVLCKIHLQNINFRGIFSDLVTENLFILIRFCLNMPHKCTCFHFELLKTN